MLKVKEVEIEKLCPCEKNPRINDHAVEPVAKSIEAFGFNSPILCDQEFNIIAGHTRWKAAKSLGLEMVPVILLDLTETQKKAFAIADNKTAELADWALPHLRQLLDELETEDVDLKMIGFSDTDLRRLFSTDSDECDEISLPDITKRTSPGDLWVLGENRLLCGNSCFEDEILRLRADQKVDFIFGGPPYFNLRSYSQWDDLESYLDAMRLVMMNCSSLLDEGGVLVWQIGNLSSEHIDLMSRHSLILEGAGLSYLDTIIWLKNGANFSVLRNAHISRNRIYYPTFQWEALLVFQKSGPMPRMTRDGAKYMSDFQSNVWEIAPVRNRLKNYGHPDSCPVEIPYRCIQAYTGKNGLVFDPFGGSGTTLIGAEKAKRRALLIEINPDYCDIIIDRWEKVSGNKAKKISL